MNSGPTTRSIVYLLLLVAGLAVALWLADALERGALLFSPQLQAASSEGSGPSFLPPGGAYDDSLLVSMQPAQRGAPLVFTTGGTVPTTTLGTVYERPLLLDASVPGVTVVRAREVVGGAVGPVASASYIVGLDTTLPVLSIIADPADLWDAKRGILANTWERGPEWERPVHVTYSDGDSNQGFEIPAGLRIHGSEPSNQPKQSFRLYFRREHGVARLEATLFAEHPYQEAQSFKRLLLEAGDRLGRWTLLRDQLVSDVAAGIGGHVTQGHFVLLFLNGEPWGIYRLSERIDRFFLEDNLGVGSADLIRDGDIEEGDSRHWDTLMDWLASHNLGEAENLAFVERMIDLESFTDYVVLQMYFGFPADRFAAVRPRVAGGRWLWLYGGWRETWLLGADPESMLRAPADEPDGLAFLLHRLLENPDYRTHFAARTADLLNTALTPTAMEAHIDRLTAELRPNIAYETNRWPAPTDWERNLAALYDLVQHRPSLLRQQIAEALGLRGTTDVTFDVSPNGGGVVFVNGIRAAGLPWSGRYFLDTDVQATAVPAPGYVFTGWEDGPAEASTPYITVTVDGPRAVTARFTPVPEDDRLLRPDDVMINEYWINDNGTHYASVGNRPIEGDWLELLVRRPRTIDLRGWRITDNDTKTSTSEGSIILPWLEALAAVPRGTVVLIIASESNANAAYFGQDDLDAQDGQMVFYVGNGNLDVTTDPGFGIGTGDDNLALLAPGPSPAFSDDIGVDFLAEGDAVTPLSFGVLVDGVTFDTPFRGLGVDDGVLFTRMTGNDSGAEGWVVDPPFYQSGDGTRRSTANALTPGALNSRQKDAQSLTGTLWLVLIGLVGAAVVLFLRIRRSQKESRKTSGRNT